MLNESSFNLSAQSHHMGKILFHLHPGSGELAHTHAHTPTRRHDRLTRDCPGRSCALRTFGRKSAVATSLIFGASLCFLKARVERSPSEPERTATAGAAGRSEEVRMM